MGTCGIARTRAAQAPLRGLGIGPIETSERFYYLLLLRNGPSGRHGRTEDTHKHYNRVYLSAVPDIYCYGSEGMSVIISSAPARPRLLQAVTGGLESIFKFQVQVESLECKNVKRNLEKFAQPPPAAVAASGPKKMRGGLWFFLGILSVVDSFLLQPSLISLRTRTELCKMTAAGKKSSPSTPQLQQVDYDCYRFVLNFSLQNFNTQPSLLTLMISVLGVSRSADAVEIRKAFANLAMTCHPDVSSEPDAATKFLLISEA